MSRIEETIEEIKFNIGATLIDIEAEYDEYMAALRYAYRIYLQRAENATQSVMVLFKAEKGKQSYNLKDLGITKLHRIFRHSIGTAYSADNQLDPFTMMYTNHFMGAASHNSQYGSIGIIHMQHMHINLLQDLLANEVQFLWNSSTKDLNIMKRIARDELLILECEKKRDLEELLDDPDIEPWIIAYASARVKLMLAQAYGKFQNLAGPNGGITLGASELRQEGKEEIDKLEEELVRLTTSTKGMPFTRG